LQAIRAARHDLEHPHDDEDDVSAETPAPLPPPAKAPGLPVWHPAYPGRCHLDDGPAISPAALQLIGCNATISTMIHDPDGSVLNAGRRSRKPSAALRRAIRERDRSRCQYPGCESRRTDAHHIQHWSNGGETSYRNMISLRKRHHTLIHDKSTLITATMNGFAARARAGFAVGAVPAVRRMYAGKGPSVPAVQQLAKSISRKELNSNSIIPNGPLRLSMRRITLLAEFSLSSYLHMKDYSESSRKFHSPGQASSFAV
jgi:HNH endonuclease